VHRLPTCAPARVHASPQASEQARVSLGPRGGALVRHALSLLLLLALGCEREPEPAPVPPAPPGPVEQTRMSLEQLRDPETCKSCHPKHYDEWAGSMHAYASTDPVFIAMNKRGQRETAGELGEFCVQCHAPMALRQGLTKDGLNLAELPKAAQGVTCYFCHNAVEAGPDHFNASLTLANDQTMRGSLRNPVDPGVHGVAYSSSHDSRSMKSSIMCGSCHDVVNPKGAHIERTFAEYEGSIHSLDRSGNNGGDSCQGCHMAWRETDYVADVPSTFMLTKRDRHDHRWAAVDVALSEFPNRAAHAHATECALSEDGAYVFEILNDGQGGFTVALETTAGHAQPSGTAQDRRLWLEFVAYDASDKVLFQSGVIADGEHEQYPAGDPKHDAQLCMFRDHFEDEAGKDVHMFWEAKRRSESTSKLLPVALDNLSNHVANCEYRIPGRVQPARVELRMRMRPVGFDVLDDLVASGDLDPAVLREMPTFTLHSTHVEWRKEDGARLRRPTPKPMPISCP
jgi:hypothetical protein